MTLVLALSHLKESFCFSAAKLRKKLTARFELIALFQALFQSRQRNSSFIAKLHCFGFYGIGKTFSAFFSL